MYEKKCQLVLDLSKKICKNTIGMSNGNKVYHIQLTCERSLKMIYTKEVENMCPVAKGAKHEPAPIPEEGKWVHSKKIEDISGFTHGVGWCAPQQGACKLSLNVKNGVIEEALVETIGCSGMTHSAAMAAGFYRARQFWKH